MLSDPAPGCASQRETSHIYKRENRQHSRSHPIRSEVLHQRIDKGDEEDPCSPAQQDNWSKGRQTMQTRHRYDHNTQITTPAETIISVEQRARSICMIKAPPIAPAPKHPKSSPYPMALSSTLLATDGSSANSELEKNKTTPVRSNRVRIAGELRT